MDLLQEAQSRRGGALSASQAGTARGCALDGAGELCAQHRAVLAGFPFGHICSLLPWLCGYTENLLQMGAPTTSFLHIEGRFRLGVRKDCLQGGGEALHRVPTGGAAPSCTQPRPGDGAVSTVGLWCPRALQGCTDGCGGPFLLKTFCGSMVEAA